MRVLDQESSRALTLGSLAIFHCGKVTQHHGTHRLLDRDSRTPMHALTVLTDCIACTLALNYTMYLRRYYIHSTCMYILPLYLPSQSGSLYGYTLKNYSRECRELHVHCAFRLPSSTTVFPHDFRMRITWIHRVAHIRHSHIYILGTGSLMELTR